MEEEFALAMRQTLAAHTQRHNSELKQREIEFSEALELAMEAKDTEQAALEVAMHQQEQKHAAAFQAQHEQYVGNICLQRRKHTSEVTLIVDSQIAEHTKKAELHKEVALVEQGDQISDAVKIALTAIENSDVSILHAKYRLLYPSINPPPPRLQLAITEGWAAAIQAKSGAIIDGETSAKGKEKRARAADMSTVDEDEDDGYVEGWFDEYAPLDDSPEASPVQHNQEDESPSNAGRNAAGSSVAALQEEVRRLRRQNANQATTLHRLYAAELKQALTRQQVQHCAIVNALVQLTRGGVQQQDLPSIPSTQKHKSTATLDQAAEALAD
jgi:hypothetical protein